MNKKVLFGSIAGAVVLAGGVGAFTLIKSPKEAYFNAEYKTANSAIEQLEERFANDIEWGEIVNKDATKTDIQLSANVEADNNFGSDDFYVGAILNVIDSSSIDLSVQSDPDENTYAVSLGAKILDFTIDPFTAYLTDKKVVGEVPFQDEALEMDLEKIYELSEGELENACISEDEFKNLVKQQEVISEDDIKHIQKEIFPEIYDVLPDDSFEKDGNKITMNLTGKNLEDVLETIGKTIEKDKVVKRIVEDMVNLSGECSDLTADEALNQLVTGLKSAEIDSSGSLKSVITVDGSQIVERELYVNEELVLEGKQDFENGITFDYNLKDFYPESDAKLKGEIGTGKNLEDKVSFSIGDEEFLTYEGQETNGKKDNEFARTLTINDAYDASATYTIHWDGTSTFNGDGHVSDNEIYAEIPDLGKVTLNIKTDGQKIKGIELPKKTVDLTSMSEEELSTYFEEELAANFEQWFNEVTNGLGALFGGF